MGHLPPQKELECQINSVRAPDTQSFLYQGTARGTQRQTLCQRADLDKTLGVFNVVFIPLPSSLEPLLLPGGMCVGALFTGPVSHPASVLHTARLTWTCVVQAWRGTLSAQHNRAQHNTPHSPGRPGEVHCLDSTTEHTTLPRQAWRGTLSAEHHTPQPGLPVTTQNISGNHILDC